MCEKLLCSLANGTHRPIGKSIRWRHDEPNESFPLSPPFLSWPSHSRIEHMYQAFKFQNRYFEVNKTKLRNSFFRTIVVAHYPVTTSPLRGFLFLISVKFSPSYTRLNFSSRSISVSVL